MIVRPFGPIPEQVQAILDYALEQGVNCFDTGWGYHGGNSETVIGAALARHPRESFLQGVPGVLTVLSGVSSLEQTRQDVDIFSVEKPLSPAETEALLELAAGMTGKTSVPCTGCEYCAKHCPMMLDIPHLLGLLNENAFTGGSFVATMALDAIPERKRPGACIGCGACKRVCPQGIDIPGSLAKFAQTTA